MNKKEVAQKKLKEHIQKDRGWGNNEVSNDNNKEEEKNKNGNDDY